MTLAVVPAVCKWGTKAEVVIVGDTPSFWKLRIQNAECDRQVTQECADAVYAQEYRVKKRDDGKYTFETCFGFVPDVWSFEYME